jgi:hypothetical protein
MKMPRRPNHRPDSDGVSISGRRKSRQSSIVSIRVKKDKDAALETYEQTVEPPGPDSTGADIPDEALSQPNRATPD